MKKLIFAVAIACVGTQFAHAEQNKNWFTGGANGTQETAVKGVWTKPGAGVTIADSKFTLELDYSSALEFTPTEGTAPDTNVMTRVVSESVVFVPVKDATMPTFGDTPPKTALAVKDSDSKYYAYADGSWVKLTGEPSDAAVNILVEIDYKRPSAPRARYGIISGMTTNFLNVADTSDAWLTLAGTSPDIITKVSFTGDGELASVRGDVQLGVAEYADVKYPTVQDAVNEAAAGGTVTILRNNNDAVTMSKTVKIDTNGKSSGTITPTGDAKLVVEMPAAATEQGNGEFTIEVKTTDISKVDIDLTDDSKEVTNKTLTAEHKLKVAVGTRDAIIADLKVAGKKLTVNPTLKAYLATYGGDSEGTYQGKNSSADTIKEQLSAETSGTRTMGQSYALGLKPTEPIILQPAGADADPDNVKLAMPNVNPNADFTVTYQVQKHNGTTWENFGDETATPQIPVGSGRFRVNTVITGK